MKDFGHIDRVAQFLSGNLPEEEREAFLDWASHEDNQVLFEEAKQLWDLSENYEDPDFEVDTTKAWNKIDPLLEIPAPEKLAQPRAAKIRKLSFAQQLLRGAAVFLVVSLTAWWFWGATQEGSDRQMVVVKTTTEDLKEVLLPDGTKVWLNGESELAYAENFSERKVELKGEAFFDVVRIEDRPFEISSGAAKTVVLGTTFNVRAYPDEENVEVSVVSGKVALVEKTNPKQSIILGAGNTGSYVKADKTVKKETANKTNSNAWKTKQLVFDNTQMREVVESLERYFKVNIEVPNAAVLNCHFTGDFRQPTLDQLIQVLEFGVGLNIKKDKDQYLFEGNGCQ